MIFKFNIKLIKIINYNVNNLLIFIIKKYYYKFNYNYKNSNFSYYF